LVAALSTSEVKEALNKSISEAVSREVSACVRAEIRAEMQALKVSIKTEIQAITQPLDDRITALEMESDRRFSVTTEQLDSLKDDKKTTNERLRNLERSYRASNLKISGINLKSPATSNEEPKPNLHELLKNKVMETFSEAGIDGLHKEDIINIQTMKTPGQPNTMILKLINESKKLHLYRQRTKLKNCATRVFMNEDLTPYDSKIFKLGRDQVKADKLFSVWTLNGRVYAKREAHGKPFLLRPDEDFTFSDL
jgi:hypothetical protein